MALLSDSSPVGHPLNAAVFRSKTTSWISLFFSLAVLMCVPQAGSQPPSAEYRLKAVFLFNFAQFVEWPPESFQSPDAPLVIGILGTDPFGKFLDETVQGEVVQGRKLEIKRFRSVEEVVACQILFVSTSETANYENIFRYLGSKPILTVGDSPEFAIRGGMVRFLTESNKIRLRINLDPVRAAKLTISSKLLRVAEIIGSQKEF